MFLYLLITLIVSFYLYLKYTYNYWNRKKIPHPKPKFFLGNLGETLSLKKNVGQLYAEFYNQYKGYDFIGVYKFMQPALLIRSPELIKHILIQDFDHFQSNDFDINDHDVIGSRNPFLQDGVKWKRVRSQVTPAFTSGKLKSMVPLTQKASSNMIDYIDNILSKSDQPDFETRELFGKYTSDNTASIAFGIEANSFSGQEDFMRMGKRVFDIDSKAAIKFLFIFNFPTVTNLLKLQFISPDVVSYFRDIVLQTLNYRKQSSVERNDFLNLMMDVRKKLGDDNFGETDVVAHSIQFIANGMESSTTTLTFMAYFIAKDLDVQKKLREEIDQVLKRHNGEISFDAIKEMGYLDQVLNETLRIYPPAALSAKRCTKDFIFPKTDNLPEYKVKAGTPLFIPIGAIQKDEKHYPNPWKFDPDRFAPENVDSIPKYTYLPFGDGPRICLGQRFAVIQVKMGIARLVQEFEIRLNKKTVEPIVLCPKSFLSKSVNPIYVNLYKRDKTSI